MHKRAARPGVVTLVALLGEPGPRHGAQQPLVRLRLLEDPAARRGIPSRKEEMLEDLIRMDNWQPCGGGRGGVGSHL